MSARVLKAASLGCDAIEPDNMEVRSLQRKGHTRSRLDILPTGFYGNAFFLPRTLSQASMFISLVQYKLRRSQSHLSIVRSKLSLCSGGSEPSLYCAVRFACFGRNVF